MIRARRDLNSKIPGSIVTLQGRSAILADHRNNTFVDVCCASNSRTFSITVTRLLVEFIDKKLASIYELGGEIPHSLSIDPSHQWLFVGFGSSMIRALSAETMELEFTLPKPHRLRSDLPEVESIPAYPDVHSLAYYPRGRVLTVVYADRSLYHWQLVCA